MKIFLHKDFLKQFLRLRENEKKKFQERRTLFMKDEFDPVLNNHSLRGKYFGCRSINITGDLRIIYRRDSDGEVIFITINSHSNLYG